MWAGVFATKIIGPIFYEYTLNGDRFLDLLQNEISELILEDWYYMEGCPAHLFHEAKQFLRNAFPGRIIAKGCDISLCPRSPDLNPLNFFLWGHIKTVIYRNRKCYRNTEELKQAIVECCRRITQHTLSKVQCEFYDRLGYCVTAGKDLFEQLL